MSDNTVPTSSIEVDVNMADTGDLEAQSEETNSAVVVKTEPKDDGNISAEPPQSPEIIPPPTDDGNIPALPELGSSTLDEEDFSADDYNAINDDFAKSMAVSQRDFNQRSVPEEVPLIDENYENAISAVEKKRTEIAKRESLGMDVTADRIELHRLEDTLLLAQKTKTRFEKHAHWERERSSMFIAEDEDSDDDTMNFLQAPPRRDLPSTSEDLITLSTSEDESIAPKEEVNIGKKRKYRRKTPVTPKAAKKSRTSRGGPPRNNAEMLDMGSLIRNDVVADARANQGLREQPGFAGLKNKAKALTALLASIPAEDRDTGIGMKKKMDLACRAFSSSGKGSMQADGVNGWRLKGMSSSLKHFQLLSAAWGVERERGSTAPFGGMLADTMGYGKVIVAQDIRNYANNVQTVQMITVMVENRPDEAAKNRITLIVVPASIATQWLEEIAKHVNDGIMENVFVYKAGCRPPEQDTVRFLKQQQVVITTYHEVRRMDLVVPITNNQ